MTTPLSRLGLTLIKLPQEESGADPNPEEIDLLGINHGIRLEEPSILLQDIGTLGICRDTLLRVLDRGLVKRHLEAVQNIPHLPFGQHHTERGEAEDLRYIHHVLPLTVPEAVDLLAQLPQKKLMKSLTVWLLDQLQLTE